MQFQFSNKYDTRKSTAGEAKLTETRFIQKENNLKYIHWRGLNKLALSHQYWQPVRHNFPIKAEKCNPTCAATNKMEYITSIYVPLNIDAALFNWILMGFGYRNSPRRVASQLTSILDACDTMHKRKSVGINTKTIVVSINCNKCKV